MTHPAIDPADMPTNIAALPRDERGYPIPWITEYVDGKPEFRLTDPDKWRQSVHNRICGMCGRVIGYWCAFIGHPELVESRRFWDPPMHVDCAEYSARTCPFLSRSGARLSGKPLPEGQFIVPPVRERPARMGVYITRAYDVMADPAAPGGQSIRPRPYKEVRWF